MNIDEALDYLDAHVSEAWIITGRAGRPPSHARIQELLDLMGNPERQYPCIHITGTNGKTSTARMVTALLGSLGLSVGTYTSPHLEVLNERIGRNGEAIGDDDLAEAISAVANLEVLMTNEAPTYFEIVTAAAFRWFADVAVDVAVIEVGLGGRWDTTNVIDGDVAVVTGVGLDHTEVLGDTLEAIAADKAGIIKPESTSVIGEGRSDLVGIFLAQPSAASLVRGRDFECTRNRLGVGGRVLDLRTPAASYDDVFLPLQGAHQGDNAACALAAVEAFLGRPVAEEIVREAFASVSSPGRLEVARHRPLVIVDGVKNPTGAAAAATTLTEDFAEVKSRILVVGLLRSKDPAEMLDALEVTKARLVIACTPPTERALAAEEVAAAARAAGVEVEVVPDVGNAVRAALERADDDDLILITGSLYVVGPARAALGLP